MKWLLALLLGSLIPRIQSQEVIEKDAYSRNQTWSFRFKPSSVDVWGTKESPYPPLSVTEAIKKSGEFMKRVPIDSALLGWDFTRAVLVSIEGTDKWYYNIAFIGRTPGIWNGPVPQFDVIVRLNGQIPYQRTTVYNEEETASPSKETPTTEKQNEDDVWDNVLTTIIQHIRSNGPDYEANSLICSAKEKAWGRRIEILEVAKPFLMHEEKQKVEQTVSLLADLASLPNEGNIEHDEIEPFEKQLDATLNESIDHIFELKGRFVFKQLIDYLRIRHSKEHKQLLFRIVDTDYDHDYKDYALRAIADYKNATDMKILTAYIISHEWAATISNALTWNFGAQAIPYLEDVIDLANSEVCKNSARKELANVLTQSNKKSYNYGQTEFSLNRKRWTFSFKSDRNDYWNYPALVNPPISPRQAIKTAKLYLKTLAEKNYEWRLKAVEVRPIDQWHNHWYYAVIFKGGRSDIAIPIRMNGLIPKPESSILDRR